MLVPSKMDLSIKTKLVNPAGNLDTATVPKLLAISYSYPPKEEPRAIQVSRLLKYLNASTVLICEGADGAGSDAESFLEKTVRVPFSQSFGRDLLNRLSSRIYLPVVSKTPRPAHTPAPVTRRGPADSNLPNSRPARSHSSWVCHLPCAGRGKQESGPTPASRPRQGRLLTRSV